MIILINCKGEQREVPEGLPYRPLDECEKEQKLSSSSRDEFNLALALDASESGLKLGDIIHGAIKSSRLDQLLGKTDCTTCERRRLILNMVGSLGLKETARQLLDTFKKES